MSLGALGPLLGCSWLVLASLLLVFELVWLAKLSFWYILSDLGTISGDLNLQIRRPHLQELCFLKENKHVLENHVFYVYLLPVVSGHFVSISPLKYAPGGRLGRS